MESAKPTASCRKISYLDRSLTKGASSQITFTLSAATASRKLSSFASALLRMDCQLRSVTWSHVSEAKSCFLKKPNIVSLLQQRKRSYVLEGSVDYEIRPVAFAAQAEFLSSLWLREKAGTISSSSGRSRRSSKARMRCCYCLHLLGRPRARMYRFCCPLGISLPTQLTASWQPLTTLSLPSVGADEFVMTSQPMPMCLAFRFLKTAKQPPDGHLKAVASITG
jgi:hypothetical protein